ncbi:MAG: GerMN domain-containing protein [Thermacetogeniaceae bacterium]
MWNFQKLKEEERERGLFRLRLVFLVIMVAVLLTMGGCSLTEKLQALQGKPSAQSNNLPDLSIGGMSNVPPQVEKAKVTVYFKDKEGRFLVPSTLEVDKVAGIAKAAMDALTRGPAQGVDVVASIPVDVQARDINVKTDGTCVVDLAGPAAKDKLTAKEEALAVYAVVDTLTEFHNVKRVQILVDGQKKPTLAGHIPIDEPLLRNLTFVKK